MTQQQEQSDPDPSPLGSLSKRDFLRLAPLGLLVGMTGTAQAAHKSSSPFPDGAWGVETIVGHGTTERPSIAELESAWSETYHFLFVDVDTGDRYYAEHGDIAWSQLGSGGGSMFGYDTVVSTTSDYTASPGELVLADASGGAIEVTLPTHTTGDVVGVKKIDTTSNTVDLIRSVETDNVDLQRGIRLDAEDEFAGVISDGGSNWWSFNEVGSFTTLVASLIIDDFEDQNLGEYTGDTGGYDIVDGSAAGDPTPIEGNSMLKNDIADKEFDELASTSGLANYFEKGDTMRYNNHYGGDGDTQGRFKFGLQDSDNHYGILVDPVSGDDFRIFKRSGGSFTELTTTNITVPTSEWLEVEVVWGTDNSIQATLFNASGTQLSQLSTTDSEFANQDGVGWGAFGAVGAGTVYFDNARLTE